MSGPDRYQYDGNLKFAGNDNGMVDMYWDGDIWEMGLEAAKETLESLSKAIPDAENASERVRLRRIKELKAELAELENQPSER